MRVIRLNVMVFLLVLLLGMGCNPNTTNRRSAPAASTSLRAVYLIKEKPLLSVEDLQTHPEIVTVKRFNKLTEYANKKVALWIDKGATPFAPEEQEWINQAPQAYYPIVLVGSRDTLHSFRDLLGLCCFMGPAGDYPEFDAPGFSVIQRKATNTSEVPAITFLQGYNQEPIVPSILEITNALLDGRLKATPTNVLLPSRP